MFLPVNDKQFEFWRLRRSGIPNINIARSFNISKQAVSKALITMDERIEKTLLEVPAPSFSYLQSTGCRCGTRA